MELSERSMPFKILTSSGRYVVEELEAGVSSVRGSRGAIEDAGLTRNHFSVYHCWDVASNGGRCCVPGHCSEPFAGPSGPRCQLYRSHRQISESDHQLGYRIHYRLCWGRV